MLLPGVIIGWGWWWTMILKLYQGGLSGAGLFTPRPVAPQPDLLRDPFPKKMRALHHCANALIEVIESKKSDVLQRGLLAPLHRVRIHRILLVARIADELEGKCGEGGGENHGGKEQHKFFLLSGIFPLNA